MPLISRRGLITGLVSLVAAPAIVRASSLMPVRRPWITPVVEELGWSEPRIDHPNCRCSLDLLVELEQIEATLRAPTATICWGVAVAEMRAGELVRIIRR